ncbi:MAG: S8 family serine peptidase [Cytophagales bacterium]|nr:S8 family serine peptidase [Cytophagales bacterium]
MRHQTAPFLCFLLLVCLVPGRAQQRDVDAVLRNIIAEPAAARRTQPPSGTPGAYLVKLRPGVGKAALAARGVTVLRTITPQYLVVRAPQPGPAGTPRAENLYEATWPVHHGWKLADDLLLRSAGAPVGLYTVRVTDPAVVPVLAALPGTTVVHAKGNVLTLRTSRQTVIDHVIPREEVLHAGCEATQPRPESPVPDLNLYANTVNQIHHHFPDLNGAGVTLSIQEQPYHPEDLDLAGRHVDSPLRAAGPSNHATDIATIAAGAGNSFVTGKGVAWGARITSSGFEDLLPDDDTAYAGLDAWVQNHSYGTRVENFYGARAEAFDGSANRNPTLLHVFSAGNEGAATPPAGPYGGVAGFANLTGNFKMAKNILTVGAVDTAGRPMHFSSRGPAYDGRIKPEVVAYSTVGTSNAAALVSGLVAVLQQAYRQQHDGALPASALLKALLINAATDAGPPGPDYLTGFGNVDGYRTLVNLREKRYAAGNLRPGESKTFTLRIPAGARNLKVTLAWNDPAARPNATPALENDLDLRLAGPGGAWLPWKLDPTADPARLAAPATRGEDHLNNVEQVSLEKPAAGTYTVAVKGFAVGAGAQAFYVAYQWDAGDGFSWSFPTGSDNMPYNGETATHFRWQSTLPQATGRLEYTLDEGRTWRVIADGVDLGQGQYRWNVPDTTARARARMVVGGNPYPTDAFTVSWPLPVTVGFHCGDSLLVQWPRAGRPERYALRVFGDGQLDELLTTADTFAVLKKSQLASPFLAVQPLLKGGPALRTRTFNYESFNASCFLEAFYAEAAGDDGIPLVVQLGATYGVAEVLVERQQGGVFRAIGTVRQPGHRVTWRDDRPAQGLNVHRVRVRLRNGGEVVSEPVRSYFLTTTPVLVFPNPVGGAGKLQVYLKESGGADVAFRLYRADGTLVLTTRLPSARETISLPNLPPGLYGYAAQTGEGYFRGKVVVR